MLIKSIISLNLISSSNNSNISKDDKLKIISYDLNKNSNTSPKYVCIFTRPLYNC
ncbi:hypothetical protein DDB_G0286477 [Dictyostelium discoideum AX4]|uniref:Putative uncharacterized protein DDB_G0286477 n=1 Tax=Dictyostelium discoideum TaxID=44689 RepID=Y8817_DICDI|nr:hypothetical protein DDB_G0286477 [Dictyostelium discoideum AX4]Q54LS0.1 RecName: Full=Putative uncharacterized protein DDB_G0286477 [Dictyostelium discoideum]EAL64263.1 hypothetical protein DDB_G0286477 [Dictyostelium discoideum AX4]|eukprot:XP_637760.1 hypothetical protein DDB_G0286477 [Dictyostelium discoideum AX4]